MDNKKFTNNGTLSKERCKVARKYSVKVRYGLTLESYYELRKKPCQICGKLARKMCIDHNIPGTYRGVLCQQCNVRLGWFEKFGEEIKNYLSKND